VNRAQQVEALAACEALAKALRENLNADARAEFVEQGCAPSWRLPGFTVSTSLTSDVIAITDEAAFKAYVAERYPTEIETVTITRVRQAWQGGMFAKLLAAGEPLSDDEGTVVPGLEFRPGGDFRSVSLLPKSATKLRLATVAAEIAAGTRPLALPSVAEVDA
jgi:hypothetical protein